MEPEIPEPTCKCRPTKVFRASVYPKTDSEAVQAHYRAVEINGVYRVRPKRKPKPRKPAQGKVIGEIRVAGPWRESGAKECVFLGLDAWSVEHTWGNSDAAWIDARFVREFAGLRERSLSGKR